MALGANTQRNVGIRRMIPTVVPAQHRNFEPNGTQTYVAMGPYSYAGVSYAAGQTIAYDAATGTLYGNPAQLERDFNAGLINPSS